MNRTCVKCKTEKDEKDFYTVKKNNIIHIRNECKQCYYLRNKVNVAKFRKESLKYKIAYRKRFNSDNYKTTLKYTYSSHLWLNKFFKYSECDKKFLNMIKYLVILKKNIKKYENI